MKEEATTKIIQCKNWFCWCRCRWLFLETTRRQTWRKNTEWLTSERTWASTCITGTGTWCIPSTRLSTSSTRTDGASCSTTCINKSWLGNHVQSLMVSQLLLALAGRIAVPSDSSWRNSERLNLLNVHDFACNNMRTAVLTTFCLWTRNNTYWSYWVFSGNSLKITLIHIHYSLRHWWFRKIILTIFSKKNMLLFFEIKQPKLKSSKIQFWRKQKFVS